MIDDLEKARTKKFEEVDQLDQLTFQNDSLETNLKFDAIQELENMTNQS